MGSSPTSPIFMKPGIDYAGITTPFYCHDGNGFFLLHKRSNKCRDEQGRWDPGSGKLEHRLDLEENVLKEVREEYGCDGIIEEALPAHSIFREHEGTKTHWVAIPFFVKVKRSEARLAEPEKMTEIGWFTLDKLPKPLHTGFAFTLSRYKKYFEKYKKET